MAQRGMQRSVEGRVAVRDLFHLLAPSLNAKIRGSHCTVALEKSFPHEAQKNQCAAVTTDPLSDIFVSSCDPSTSPMSNTSYRLPPGDHTVNSNSVSNTAPGGCCRLE